MSTLSNTVALREAEFIGDVMCTTLSYLQENECESSPKTRNLHLRRDHEVEHNQQQPTIILEAVALYDFWMWHAFFGPSGANNEINILDQLLIFNGIFLGKSYDVPFVANETSYKRGYYLTIGIYPKFGVFVKSFTCPNDDKRLKFKSTQESATKDIEHAFGLLKRRWQIHTVPIRFMEHRRISTPMHTCFILHNMILEDEGKKICCYNENESLPNAEGVCHGSETYTLNRAEVYDRVGHHNLRADLV
uniref:DDE Tnp4 domain-containing protein n=1 Tax=Lactuca sativa TaxID=4236 RepID=A0A9R1XEC0_LACSA|nr:hypothetical protein LSAT_V11C400186250 [Lactuca sativa]